VARELAPAGREAAFEQALGVNWVHCVARFRDCFAVQREQAPSPQVLINLTCQRTA